MKDILTVVARLTISCLVAGLVMGGTFVLTNRAKQHNEHVREQKVMMALLGYTDNRPAPASLAMHSIYRYVVGEGDSPVLGYLVPLAGGREGFTLLTIDLDGRFLDRRDVALAKDNAAQAGDRDRAVQAAAGRPVRFADQTIVVMENGQRRAYLLPGEFPGFKTFIRVMLALTPEFAIQGLEIMEHEEDPGLGAEITQKYFKNQFRGKDRESLKDLDVVKTPLPEEYRAVLEAGETGGPGPEEIARVEALYRDKEIYALTGATISSRAVTSGVKGITRKFAYRLAILDRVLKEQAVSVPF